MTIVLTVLHVMVCIFLIGVVLLQRGKGAEMGAVFGGGASSTVFGSRGAGNFLTKLTTAAAIVFMGTSLTLAYLGTSHGGSSLFQDEEPAAEAPAPEASPFAEPQSSAPGAPAATEPDAPAAPAAGAPAPAAP